MKIVITSDLHLGMGFDYKKKGGVSERINDFLIQLKKVVDHAIAIGAEFIIIAGDFYDKPVINATVKKMLIENIITPVLDKIRFFIIGGNHDSPIQLSRGCDIEQLALTKKITCIRSLANNVVKYTAKNGETVGMVFLPYHEPQSILDYYMREKVEGLDNVKEITNEIAVEFISRDIIAPGLKKLDGMQCKLLVGHYYVEGSNLPPVAVAKSMTFSPVSLHASNFDAVFMGHLHEGQDVLKNIFIPGSVECVKFDERDHKKFFIEYDTVTKECKKIPLTCRKMIQIDVDVSTKKDEPVKTILDAIKKEDIKDALVKIVISATQTTRNAIRKDEERVVDALKDCFHPIISYKIFDEERPMIDMSRVELDHDILLDEFVKMKFKDPIEQKKILGKASEILKLCEGAASDDQPE